MNILLALVGIFFTNVVGSDVFNLNADKLFNFSTSYSLTGNHINFNIYYMLNDILANGNIQFDLYGEQLKITLNSSLSLQKSFFPYGTGPRGLMKYFIGATQTASSTISVDGKAGNVAFEATSTTKKGFYSFSESACSHAKVPMGYYSAAASAGLSNPRLLQGLSFANQSLNRLLSTGGNPHARFQVVVNDGVATITNNGWDVSLVAELKLDGTPISAAETLRLPNYGGIAMNNTLNFGVAFTNFVKGAGTLTPLTCSEGSSTALSSIPGIVHSIALAERFIAHLSDSNPAVGEFVSKFPPLSELFPQMMMEEPEPDLMPWSVVLVSFACGAGLVLVLIKFSSSTTKLRREPLLEEA